MKRAVWVIFFLILGFQVIGQSLSGDTWAEAKQAKKGKIVITYTEAPKYAEKVNGKYQGLTFDIMKDFIAFVNNKYGVQLSVDFKAPSNPKDFDEFLNMVKNGTGGVFGLGDVTITEKRKAEFNFSPSYFSNVAILATHQDAPTLKSINTIASDFSGMKAVVQNGTTHEERLKRLKASSFQGLQIETKTGFEEANKVVASNKNYFTYIDFSTYMNVLENKIPLKRHPAGDQKGEDFGIIMPKNSDWGPVIDEFFAKDGGYTKSVEYRKLMADHLGNHVVKMLGSMN